MPPNAHHFLRRITRRETIGEIAALFGTTLLLLLMMSQPDRDEPLFQVLWGAVGLGLVAGGSYLILTRRPGRPQGRGSEREPGRRGLPRESD
jgi:hypothetical protein